MPRICFEHPEIDAWYQKSGEGTSTFDVCDSCFTGVETAEDLGLTDKGYNGDPIPADAIAVDIDGVPDIEDCDYDCETCNESLNDDNY